MVKEGEIGDNMETLQQLLFSNVQNIATTSVYSTNSTSNSSSHPVSLSNSNTALDPPATSLFISSIYQKLGEVFYLFGIF